MTRLHHPWILVLLFVLLATPSGVAAQETPEPWVLEADAPQFFAVRVRDLDAAVAWYESALGLRKLDDTRAEDDRWRIVNLSSEELFVEVVRDNRAQDAERPRGFFKVGFRVADVERVADRVEKATGERPRVVDFARHGVRILQLEDPEGNTLQLTSSLEAPADD